jgi:hypothetical protein
MTETMHRPWLRPPPYGAVEATRSTDSEWMLSRSESDSMVTPNGLMELNSGRRPRASRYTGADGKRNCMCVAVSPDVCLDQTVASTTFSAGLILPVWVAVER